MTCAGDGFSSLPVQIISLADENGNKKSGFPYPSFVFRYQVIDGWIVGTVFGDMSSCTQSFVPDPDYVWTPTFLADDKPSSAAPQS